jgi:uncharacterized protein YbjT (DUF2867 family)
MRLFLKIIGVIVLLLLVAIGGIAMSMRAHMPDTTFEARARTVAQPTDDQSSVLIFGATRNTGFMVAQRLVERGDRVTVLVRPTSDTAALEELGVDIVVGDAMDIDSIRAVLAAGDYRAVLSTIGCLSCDPPPDFLGNANIIDATVEADIGRLVLVTSVGAGDSADAAPWLSARFLSKILPLKTQAEDKLRASGLDYTIVRPGGLRSGRRTGNGILTEESDAFGYIFREDLAELLVAVLDDDRAIGKTFAALDANRNFPWSNE